MNLLLNGKLETVTDGETISELLARLGLPQVGVAVERNREIVPRSRHPFERLREGDHLEVITFVGGG